MKARLLSVPYDSGRRSFRLGRGPEHLFQGGLLARLAAAGHRIETEDLVIRDLPVPSDIGSAMAINRELAVRVRRVIAAEAFPLVFAGNCGAALGILAGIGPERTAVVWFDSHGDLNTPETTSSGLLDGMALSMVLGRCWTAIARSVTGWVPVAEERVALVAARDFDPPELSYLTHSAVTHVRAADLRERGPAMTLGPVLDRLATRAQGFYLHLDLDVVDPGDGAVNQYQAPNGPSLEALAGAVRLAAQCGPIAAAAITAYDPAIDADGRAASAAYELMGAMLEGVRATASRRPRRGGC